MFEWLKRIFSSDIPYNSDLKKIRDRCYKEYNSTKPSPGFLQPMERYLCSRCAGRAYRFLVSKGIVCKIVLYYLPKTDPRVSPGENRTHAVIRIYKGNRLYTLDPSSIPLKLYEGYPGNGWILLSDICQPLEKEYSRETGGIYG